MKLLVTGAAGFIGSTFVRLVAGEHEVVVLDKLTYAGRRENLDGVEHTLVEGAIEDPVANPPREPRSDSQKITKPRAVNGAWPDVGVALRRA